MPEIQLRRIRGAALVLAAHFVCAAASLAAQSTATRSAADRPVRAGHSEPRPEVLALRRAAAISLDGRLAETDWARAPAASGFQQQEPHDGDPAVQRTEVRFLFDDDNLYIGARMYDTDGREGVRGRLVRRDQQQDGDYLQLVLDTYHDHAGRTVFQINPEGSRYDAGQAAPNTDESWDPVWQAATAVDSLGWTAELRIPLSQLRFPADSLQTWGLQVWRYEERTHESSMWAYWPRGDEGGPQRFGHLDGLRFGPRPRSLELLPYLVTRGAYVRPTEAGSPFQDPSDYTVRAGADFKAVLTSTLTLDATVNPDFGQVEADPAEVNLSAFETYFSERRPFFVEGSGLFSFGGLNCYFCSNVSGMSLFYSRRIGRAPHGSAPADARYAERPENTTILGAAKVTGRTASGLQVGLLDATTAARDARYIDGAGQPARQPVEPFTNYFVGRVRKNMRGGTLRLGAMGTSVVRDLRDPALQQLVPTHAEALGADWELNWKSQTYRLMGNLAVSNVNGSADAIRALQNSSARYFDRPDRAAHGNGLFTNAYDPNATALRGFGGYSRLSKEQGILRWEASVNFRSPGFEVNDLAYLTRADYAWMNANLYAFFSKPTHWYRWFELLAGGQQQYNFDGDRTDLQFQTYAGMQTTGYWYLSAYVIERPDRLDDRTTRGGPVVKGSGYRMAQINIDTDSRKRLQLGLYPNVGRGYDGFEFWNLSLYGRLRLASNVNLSVGPYFGHYGTRAQFVRSFDDPTATHFYGRRVVFAEIRQQELALDTRLNATFTPDLTLELFVRPYVSAGAYTDFKEFERPRTRDLHIFDASELHTEIDPSSGRVSRYCLYADCGHAAFTWTNPDFNFRSLRGNAVLRWEWRPGSTLYLVWQQNRAGSEGFGDFALDRDLNGVFRQHADNTFLVKVSYWLGR